MLFVSSYFEEVEILQIFTGVIVAQIKDGEQYLLKTGESLLSVRSEKPF